MPNYDYKCSGCTKKFVLYAKIDDRHAQACPACDAVLTLVMPRHIAVHYHTDGFAHQEIAKDKHNQLISECESEGYVSKTEMEVGAAAAIERAEKKGYDPAVLVGKETLARGGFDDDSGFADALN